MNEKQILIYAVILGAVTFSILATFQYQAQATGGAGQIAGKIMSILEDAQTYLNEGDTQAAQKEIQDAINELKDTYEADQK